MNNSELTDRFWKFNNESPLGSTGVALYLFLVKVGGDQSDNNFTYSDLKICKELCIKRNTVKSAREKLRNLGLIHYQTKNGFPCYYKLITDYPLIQGNIKPKKDVAERNQKPIEAKEKSKPDSPAELPVEEPVVVNPSSQEPVKPNIITDNKAVPTMTEIIDYATTLPNYDPSLDTRIQDRYKSWVNNGWRTMQDKPIKEWKPLLKSTVNYFVNPPKNGTLTLDSIPNIKIPKPKSTYNE
ncbi:hypothetical protein [Elizabethkingia anophelis]|uniref:hypothetical protein n=1 Tax=Elizabethkingia anophelis TaxID=1117645 RepID=UPI00320AB40C